MEAEDCRAEAALEAGSSASVEPFHLGHGKCASIGPSQGTNQMGTICKNSFGTMYCEVEFNDGGTVYPDFGQMTITAEQHKSLSGFQDMEHRFINRIFLEKVNRATLTGNFTARWIKS